MNRSSIMFGFWSAVLMFLILIAYTISMGVLTVLQPSVWTTISGYVTSINETWHVFLAFCQLATFLCAVLFLVLVNSIYDYTEPDKKYLSRTSICFAVIFTALSSINYFIQFNAVKQNIMKEHLEGLHPFIQLYPSSTMFALAMLGWTLFLGLSSLFIAPVFKDGKLESVIRTSFLINGIICIIGCFAYMFDILWLHMFYTGVMEIAMIVIAISLSVLFKRIEKSSGKNKAQ